MLTWQHVLLVLAVFLSARLLSFVVRWVLRHAAEKAPPRLRPSILRVVPIARLLIGMEKPWGTQYRLKVYVKESRDQFLFITDLTIRGKEALRVMGIRFAQAPYAETKRS